MSISFVVTAYKETTRGGPSILKCLAPAVAHSAIDEIVVVDDCSGDFEALTEMVKDVPKLKLYENPSNYGVFGNKLSAVSHATSDWVMCCDSDNTVDKEFIDLIMLQDFDENVWYSPSFAKPQFNYQAYIGEVDLSSVARLVQDGGLAHCLLNTGNQTMNRARFMQVFEKYLGERADLMMPNLMQLRDNERSKEYWRLVFDACDSIRFNAEWIKSGGKLKVVAGLEYSHFYTSTDDSNYNRAPPEKGILNELILADLLKASCA